MDGELTADVADGTATGRMISRGLRTVLETLSASEYDIMHLRRALVEKPVEYQMESRDSLREDTVTNDEDFCLSTPSDLGLKVLRRLVHSAPRNVTVVCKRGAEVADNGVVNLTGSINLGRGNKLPTAVHGCSECANIECVGLLETLAWSNSSRPSRDAAVSAVDLIEAHFDALVEEGPAASGCTPSRVPVPRHREDL